ncbi:hypothetical protein [Mycoplasmopsis columbinasalis]|uniref:Rho termination factor N-terminal domain-containing protein n=1 Tax=Mycoplasmopsis columbinasalis TaxID=114880 RepID=A0A449BAY2_9BACT|nr:hypothetical protein [Mycoplasmopsis columbinasalis]VEU78341.1 Uncharacterised protein [Mycoplasmopsis columbinasalis]
MENRPQRERKKHFAGLGNFFANKYNRDYVRNPILNIEEMWKQYEKSKFRYFIVGTLVFMVLSMLIYLAILILTLVFKNLQINDYILELSNSSDPNPAQTAANAFNTNVTLTGINVGIMAIGVVLYSLGVFDSYKQKDFSNIRISATYIYSFFTLINFVNIVLSLVNRSTAFKQAYYFLVPSILVFVSIGLMILGYFLFVRENKYIRFAFIRIHQTKKTEELMKLLQQNQQNGNSNVNDFFSTIFNLDRQSQARAQEQAAQFTEEDAPNQTDSNSTQQAEAKAETTNSVARQKLEALSDEQLHQVAQKLNIFGYQQMSRQNLIDLILNIVDGKTTN